MQKTIIMVLFVLGALLNLSFHLYSIFDGKPGMNYEAKDGDYYYSNSHKGVYSYNIVTKEKIKLSNYYSSSSQFHLYDGWIYFDRHRTFEVYRVRTDGTEHMQILSNSGYYWLADNMIYFDGSKHGYLHRANLDGTDMKKLTDFVIDRFEEIDDDIYIRRNKDDKWFLIDNKTDELIPIKKLPKK